MNYSAKTAINNKQSISQKQNLLVNQKMRQAINILAMSSLELRNEINQNLANNVMLELDDNLQFEQYDEYSEMDSQENQDDDFEEKPFIDIDQLDENLLYDLSWDEVYNDGTDWKELVISNNNNDEDTNYEEYTANEMTLQQSLEEQLLQMTLHKEVLKYALKFIWLIDDNGRLPYSDVQLATEFKTTRITASKAMSAIKSCSPTGVGAFDLKECLCMQIELLPKDTPYLHILKRIMSSHFKDIVFNQEKILKNLGISEKELAKALNLLRELSPNPSEKFQNLNKNSQNFIKPDIVVQENNGISYIESSDNKHEYSNLRINEEYVKLIKQTSAREKILLNHHLETAKWLISALDYRANIIKKVATLIVALQQDFFQEGERALLPLSRSKIAKMLDVHESTISRATKGKYLSCRRGVFELSYFFSASIGNKHLNTDDYDDENNDFDDSEGNSRVAVKKIIKELINAESINKPLKDQQIADVLKMQHKINISRRTVVKYRQEMDIPIASKRKKI